jgi:hypothetical protein
MDEAAQRSLLREERKPVIGASRLKKSRGDDSGRVVKRAVIEF